jgi:hypothetical protein
MKPSLYILLASTLLLSACEQLFLQPEAQNEPQAIFDAAWRFADQEYSFFDYKNVDWDEVRSRYEPLVSADMTEEELFKVVADMMFELKDGHVNLVSDFDVSRNWNFYLNSPPNFDADLLERHYFQAEQQYWLPFTVYDFGDVAYLYLASFNTEFPDEALDGIMSRFADYKGIILDVRNNGGGQITHAEKLAKRFAETERVIGRWRFKSGPAHDDFTPWEDIGLLPARDEDDNLRPHFYGPVALLTNRSSYSATTFFTQYMRELPNVTVVGDTTGGGGGAPSYTELANGWQLRVSATQLVAPDGFNVEDGIPPDVQLDLDPDDVANGEDTILEEALRLIREG